MVFNDEKFYFSVGFPFAVTEYAEQSLEVTIRVLGPKVDDLLAELAIQQKDGLMVRLRKRKGMVGTEKVLVNPWARPGQRGIGAVKVPNVHNGFGLAITTLDAR
jgi:hypothetical protein